MNTFTKTGETTDNTLGRYKGLPNDIEVFIQSQYYFVFGSAHWLQFHISFPVLFYHFLWSNPCIANKPRPGPGLEFHRRHTLISFQIANRWLYKRPKTKRHLLISFEQFLFQPTKIDKMNYSTNSFWNHHQSIKWSSSIKTTSALAVCLSLQIRFRIQFQLFY